MQTNFTKFVLFSLFPNLILIKFWAYLGFKFKLNLLMVISAFGVCFEYILKINMHLLYNSWLTWMVLWRVQIRKPWVKFEYFKGWTFPMFYIIVVHAHLPSFSCYDIFHFTSSKSVQTGCHCLVSFWEVWYFLDPISLIRSLLYFCI